MRSTCPVRPWMLGLGAAMSGGILLAGIREGVSPEENRLRRLGFFLAPGRFWRVVDEVRAVIGEHGVDGVRNGSDQGLQKVGGYPPRSTFVQFGESKLAGAINGYKQIKLALFGPHLGDIDMEIADGLSELLFRVLVAFDFRHAADAVTLKTEVGRSASASWPKACTGSYRVAETCACQRLRLPSLRLGR